MSLGMKWRFPTPSPPPLGILGSHYSTSLCRKGCSMLLKAQAPSQPGLSTLSTPALGCCPHKPLLTARGPPCGSLSQPHASQAHPGPGAQTPGPSLVPGTERRQTASPELNGLLLQGPLAARGTSRGPFSGLQFSLPLWGVTWLICGLPWTPGALLHFFPSPVLHPSTPAPSHFL